MDNKSYRNVIVERKAGSGCLVFPLWGRSINIDSWVQPRGPRLSRSGVGPRNVRSIKHSGDSGASAPKARLGKATPWFIPFLTCSLKCIRGLSLRVALPSWASDVCLYLLELHL